MTISAHDFAGEMGDGFAFSTSVERASARLEQLAAELRIGVVVLTKVHVENVTEKHEFTLTKVTLTLAEKITG